MTGEPHPRPGVDRDAGPEGTPRLFLSIPPPPALLARIVAVQEGLAAAGWTLRLSEPQDLHLTLHFLGATPARLVDDLRREIGALCHARRAFDLGAGGLGCFPDDERPRVVWLGVRDPALKLAELFQASRRLLNAYRLFELPDGLVPHLSLARVSRLSAAWDPGLLRALAPQWADLGDYPVERVQLMRSRAGIKDGPRYEVLADLTLK